MNDFAMMLLSLLRISWLMVLRILSGSFLMAYVMMDALIIMPEVSFWAGWLILILRFVFHFAL